MEGQAQPVRIDDGTYTAPVTALAALPGTCTASGMYDISMWIDAICINQTDLDEKGYQVELMGDIYSKASHVLIWLGNLGPHYGVGPRRTLSEIARYTRTRTAGQEFEWRLLDHVRNLDQAQVAGLDSDQDNVRAFCQFFEAPWFTRLWMMQEVCLLGTQHA